MTKSVDVRSHHLVVCHYINAHARCSRQRDAVYTGRRMSNRVGCIKDMTYLQCTVKKARSHVPPSEYWSEAECGAHADGFWPVNALNGLSRNSGLKHQAAG